MSVVDWIREGRYENKVPFSIEKVPVNEETMTVRQAREHREAQDQRARDQRYAHYLETSRLNGLFRSDLMAENGLTGHPKEQKVWDMAWDRGHSSGYSEVAYHYEELADLVKD